jgi:hypothetical protein
MKPTRHHQGFALIVSLLLLLVLTTVALIAVRGSGMETQMAANTVMRTESFQVSEAGRVELATLVDVHAFNRGWPAQIGGTVQNAEFNLPIPSGLTICAISSDASVNECVAPDPATCVEGSELGPQQGDCPRAWYVGNTELDTFRPTGRHLDAQLRTLADNEIPLRVDLSVWKLATALNTGSGAAMVAGYEGTGKAAAASGGLLFFYVNSRGFDQTRANGGTDVGVTASRTDTGADVRHVIRN